MRLVVYTDYVYRRRGETIYAERAFALFLLALRRHARITLVGRLDPAGGPTRYPLPSDVEFVGLPHFPSFSHPAAALSSLVRSIGIAWRALASHDGAWILGPSPHALLLAGLALLRRRRLTLGIRQDYPTYIRSRRPQVRWMHRSADLLEAAWRTLARFSGAIVVGPDLARHYGAARRLLEITVSLVSEDDVDAGERAGPREYAQAQTLQLLSVGRLDSEKNPLLLADALQALRRHDPRWTLVSCGEGPLEPALRNRLEELGLSSHATLRGYLPLDGGLLELYRSSHVFLHVSLTEGVPQVLLEAFASGTPVVATAVGGVAAAAGDAALLIGPRDPQAAADAVARVVSDPALREALVRAGFAHARAHTLEREVERVAAFLGA